MSLECNTQTSSHSVDNLPCFNGKFLNIAPLTQAPHSPHEWTEFAWLVTARCLFNAGGLALYTKSWGSFFFSPHDLLSKHCWLYYQEGFEINDSGDSCSSQQITTTFHRETPHKPRLAEYREAQGQDGSFTAGRQRSEQMMNTSGLLWVFQGRGATG